MHFTVVKGIKTEQICLKMVKAMTPTPPPPQKKKKKKNWSEHFVSQWMDTFQFTL